MSENTFHPMQELPPRTKNALGEDENMSISVLLYSDDELLFCEIGYYDYELQQWLHFGQTSIKLICWSLIPNPTQFVLNNPNLKPVKHVGYRP